MNVDRRWLGTSLVEVRILAAGLVLLAAGCVFLAGGSRLRQTAANTAAHTPAIQSKAIPANRLAAAISPSRSAPSDQRSRALAVLTGLPLMFEPNRGQANLDASDPRAKFVARGSGYSLFLGSEGAILSLAAPDASTQPAARPVTRFESLQMKLAGASPHASLTGADPLPGKSNYIVGNDPAKWRRDIPQFSRVRYENVYPGIDLVFYGNQGRLEYDFHVAPGSDPAQAELQFDRGKKLELNDGALVVKGQTSSVRLEAPRVYQQVAGRLQSVESSFVLRGANRAGFAIGAYDRSRELVIDPVVTYSTYFGGSGNEHSVSVAVDGSFIYLAGSTTSPDLPIQTPVFQSTLNPAANAQNVFIAKLDPTRGASGLISVTYLGGSGTDYPVGVAVDGGHNLFVAGTTTATDFPTTTTTAYQTAPETGSAGALHVFVTELKFDFSQLLYSSYLSGNGDDVASGMTIDTKGYIYVTGTTTSSDAASTSVQFPASTLPQSLPYQSAPRAPKQFFVTKVNTAAPRTGSIAYSTYFGGGNFATTDPIATGGGIAVDTNGNIYFTGTTNFIYTGCQGCQTTDFPILNAYQPCLDQIPPVTIVNPPTCSTTTTTNSDAFAAKLNPNAVQGSQLLWSTYLGGSQTDSSTDIALDSGAANVYITGTTNSPDITIPASIAPYQRCLDNIFDATTKACTPPASPANDAFVARFSNPASTTTTTTNVSLTYFSYLGGTSDEAGLAIAVDSASGALVTGWTQSPDFPFFPNPNEIQSHLNGSQDAFVARLNTAAVTGQTDTASWANYFGGNGVDQGTGIAVDTSQNTYLAGDTSSQPPSFQVNKPYQAANNGGFDAFVTELGTAASLDITGSISLGTNQTYVSAGSPATFTYTLTNRGPDLASSIVVTDNLSSTGVPVSFVSASATSGTCSGGSTSTNVSCSVQSLQSGSTATITIVLTPTASTSGSSATFNGGTVLATAANNVTPAQISVSGLMSDFSISVSPSNVSVLAAGDTATYQVQLIPHPVFGTNITLACSGLPTGASCSPTTNPVTLQGSSGGGTTLSITTTARPIITPSASLLTRRLYAVWLTVPGLALIGLGAGGRRRRRIAGMLLLGVLFALLLLQPACSHSTTPTQVSGTPTGVYPVTLTATAGNDTKSTTFTLTVP